MSKYTTEVRFLCENYAGLTQSADYPDIYSIIDKAAPMIFQAYPLFDETYRATLNRKILAHYYTREIGLETPGLWKFKLNVRLNEIMPYYNLLYESAAIKYNPLYDTDYRTEHQGSGTHDEDMERGQKTQRDFEEETSSRDHATDSSQSSAETKGEGETNKTAQSQGTSSGTTSMEIERGHKDRYSDTPQGQVTNVDQDRYLTNYRNIAETEDQDGTTTGKTTGTESSNATTNQFQEDSQTSSGTHDGTQSGEFSHGETGSLAENLERGIKTTDQYLRHVYGKTGPGTYAKMILEYRETLLNIDGMIIDALEDLFMQIW